MRYTVYLFFCSLLITLSGCEKYPWDECDVGEGDNFEYTRNLPNFHTFRLDIPAKVTLTPDTNLTSSKLVIKGQKNVVDKISSVYKDGEVSVSFSDCFKSHNDIEFHIYTPWLQKITLNAASRLSTTYALYGDHFTIEVNQGTNINMGCHVDSIYTSFRNGGTINLHGYASRQVLESSSSGKYMAPDLLVDSTIINMTGNSYANVYCIGHLIANVDGSGIIDFTGEDTLHVTTNVNGSGMINDLR